MKISPPPWNEPLRLVRGSALESVTWKVGRYFVPSVLTVACASATSMDSRMPREGTRPQTTTASSSTSPPAPSPTHVAKLAPDNPTESVPKEEEPRGEPVHLQSGGKGAVLGEAGVVTSVETLATRAGIEILRKGGNAIDAAVAVAYVLAVTHPSAGNIAGGGFMMVRLSTGETRAIDFRETAPAATTTEKILEMLKRGGFGYASAPIPGSVAGLNYALERYGSKPRKEVMGEAIRLARQGYQLGAQQASVLAAQWPHLRNDPSARSIYGRGGASRPLRRGETLKQPDLARTLERIADLGDEGFYGGPIASKIEEAMRRNGGSVTAKDLRGYRVKERAPLRFTYRDLTVETMPPPSMGGIAVAEIMLQLERLEAYRYKPHSPISEHFFLESARRAYATRRLVGADPEFQRDETRALLAKFLDREYLASIRPAIDPASATDSARLELSHDDAPKESAETTHFSIVDQYGNAVSCTTTQSASFGAKVIVPGTGVLLSNALGAFSVRGPNDVAPQKRMSSSMSPTVVSQAGKTVLVLGSPGGDTIPNTVAQVLRNVADYGMTIDAAIRAPRMHHQHLPDKVRVEKNNLPPKGLLEDLKKRGHKIDMNPASIGDANNILIGEKGAYGFADPREGGAALGLSRDEVRRKN